MIVAVNIKYFLSTIFLSTIFYKIFFYQLFLSTIFYKIFLLITQMPVKKKSNNLAANLIADRFSTKQISKKFIQRNSITEFTPLLMLNEKLSIENKTISNSKENIEKNSEIIEKYSDLIESLDYSLSIPPRIPYKIVDSGDFKALENFVFNRWKFYQNDKIFERNIEIWRQFWITCERSTTIAQILDSRNPELYFNKDIIAIYPDKSHLLLINKSDLISVNNNSLDINIANFIKNTSNNNIKIDSYVYSTKTSKFDYPLTGSVGLIGYPNVGKSSTINMILNQKKVKVSSTPGKTKYIQTIETPNFTLLDCPGLVFPKHPKIELVLMGILNVDQITDLHIYEDYIIKRIGIERLIKNYKMVEFTGDFLTAMSIQKGWIKSYCLKVITKDFALGLIKQ